MFVGAPLYFLIAIVVWTDSALIFFLNPAIIINFMDTIGTFSSGKCCYNGRELDSIISIGWDQPASLDPATGYCESPSPLQVQAGAGREMRT